MHAWIDVALLAKTRNLNGGFVARAAAGLPFLLEPGDEVAFVPPQLDAPRRGVVESVRPIDEKTAEVSFVGMDAQTADMLVGCHCLVPRSSFDSAAIQETPAIWEGWMLVDEQAGDIGSIVGIIDNPGQALLEVERFDGAGGLLVPVVDEIIRDVDESAGIVRAALPQGLLDL